MNFKEYMENPSIGDVIDFVRPDGTLFGEPEVVEGRYQLSNVHTRWPIGTYHPDTFGDKPIVVLGKHFFTEERNPQTGDFYKIV